jgi:hypothetical protein
MAGPSKTSRTSRFKIVPEGKSAGIEALIAVHKVTKCSGNGVDSWVKRYSEYLLIGW